MKVFVEPEIKINVLQVEDVITASIEENETSRD